MGKVIENIEKSKLESGMIALYPELWDEIEKEHKGALLDTVKKEINYALDQGDYGYAAELAEDLFKHFESRAKPEGGKNMLPGHRVVSSIDEAEAAGFKLSQPIERRPSEFEGDVRQMIDPVWDEFLKNLKDRNKRNFNTAIVAADMKQFNGHSFGRGLDYGISKTEGDSIWHDAANLLAILKNQGRRFYFVELAQSLKRLDPERFSKEIKLSEKDISDVIKDLKQVKASGGPDSLLFVSYYEKVSSLVGKDRLEKDLSITNNDWRKIKESYGVSADWMRWLAFKVSANKVRPKDVEPLEFSKSDLDGGERELRYTVGHDSISVFAQANTLLEAERQMLEADK